MADFDLASFFGTPASTFTGAPAAPSDKDLLSQMQGHEDQQAAQNGFAVTPTAYVHKQTGESVPRTPGAFYKWQMANPKGAMGPEPVQALPPMKLAVPPAPQLQAQAAPSGEPTVDGEPVGPAPFGPPAPGFGPAGMAAKMVMGGAAPAPAAGPTSASLPTTPPAQPPAPQGDPELEAAQRAAALSAAQSHQGALLAQAGALMRGVENPDLSNFRKGEDNAQQGVKDLLARREQLRQQTADQRQAELYDRNSDVSQAATKLARMNGLIGPNEQISASQWAMIKDAGTWKDAHDRLASDEKREQDKTSEEGAYHKALIDLGYAKLNHDKSSERDAKEEDRIERDVSALEKQEAPLAEVAHPGGAIDILKDAIAKSDVPGVGLWDSHKPEFMLGEDERDVRQAAEKVLQNLASAKRWNKQQTDLIRQQYGLSGGNENMFRSGVKKLIADTYAAQKTIEAGHRPEAKARFMERGGFVSDNTPSTAPKDAAPVPQAKPAPAQAVSPGPHPLPTATPALEPGGAVAPVDAGTPAMPASQGVKVTDTKTGKTKTLSPEVAAKYLANPQFVKAD